MLSNDRSSAVSPDGKTITLASPLAFDHPGARDLNGRLDFLPHVADLSRNVVVKSESATGTRGYTMFSQRADVDIEGVQFSALGRSTTDGWDNTQFDGSGAVSHIGGNEIGRYPVYFRHLKANGILAVHVSNRYLDLEPIVQLSANAIGKEAFVVNDNPTNNPSLSSSTWVLVANPATGGHSSCLSEPLLKARCQPIPARPDLQTWTDDYSNLFDILKKTISH